MPKPFEAFFQAFHHAVGQDAELTEQFGVQFAHHPVVAFDVRHFLVVDADQRVGVVRPHHQLLEGADAGRGGRLGVLIFGSLELVHEPGELFLEEPLESVVLFGFAVSVFQTEPDAEQVNFGPGLAILRVLEVERPHHFRFGVAVRQGVLNGGGGGPPPGDHQIGDIRGGLADHLLRPSLELGIGRVAENHVHGL